MNETAQNCSQVLDWYEDSIAINAFALTTKCLTIVVGLTVNLAALWILLQHPLSPFDIIQLNQCFGSCLEGTLCLPLFFGALHYRAFNLVRAFRLYSVLMGIFLINWSFQMLASVLVVIIRALQICRMCRRNILSCSRAIGFMALFWALAAFWPAYGVIQKNIKLGDKVSDILSASQVVNGVYVGVALLGLLVTAAASFAVHQYLKRNFNLGFGTMHLKKAMDTILIGLAALYISQVSWARFGESKELAGI